MISRRSANPFETAPYLTAADQLRGLYPCPFFADQILDAFFNIDSYAFTITCVQDLLDAEIALTEAAAIGAVGGVTGRLLALGLTADWLVSSGNLSVTGATEREACPPTNYASGIPGGKAAVAYPICRDIQFRHIYAKSLFLVVVDFGATKRALGAGAKQSAKSMLFYPSFLIIGFLGGYMLSNDLLLLQGAGQVTGGVNIDGSEGVVTQISALTASGAPIGNPSLFGELSISSRYDKIKIGINGGMVNLSGIPFTSIPTSLTSPNEGIFFGSEQCQTMALQSDGSIIATPPSGFIKDYLTFRATNGNIFTTRNPVVI